MKILFIILMLSFTNLSAQTPTLQDVLTTIHSSGVNFDNRYYRIDHNLDDSLKLRKIDSLASLKDFFLYYELTYRIQLAHSYMEKAENDKAAEHLYIVSGTYRTALRASDENFQKALWDLSRKAFLLLIHCIKDTEELEQLAKMMPLGILAEYDTLYNEKLKNLKESNK